MKDQETDIPKTIFKLMGTKRSAQRWREYGAFGLIMLAIAGLIGLVGALQYYASKLP